MSHVIAISGTHVVYIMVAVKCVLYKIIKSKKIINMILIIFLIFFAIFTGGSASCVRACIMMEIILISEILYRRNDFFTTWCISLGIILLINFYNIENIGMWLSFMCVLGMQKLNSKDSFAVQFAIFPIILYSFNTVSLTFFISNFFASFIVGSILILGYISLALGKYFKFIVIIEELLLEILFKIAEIVGNLKFSKIYVSTPNIIFFIIYYIILFFIMFAKNKKELIQKILANSKVRFILKKSVIIFSIFCVIFIILNFKENKAIIIFLDVSQGDCTLIKTKTNKTILIDGGENGDYDYGENVVLPYLLKHKINSLDYVMVSHFDSDHCGGLFFIIENLKVSNIIIGYQYEESENFLNFINIAKEKEINVIFVKSGDRLQIDKYTYFDILFPIKNEMITENAINNNSLVAKINFIEDNSNISMLFTGDIEQIAEEKLVSVYGDFLKSDILKVAHHGSNTSSMDEFLKLVNPQIALIGVGKNNSFGHPSIHTIKKLEELNVNIYRTDENGEIDIILENKNELKINKLIE